MNKQIANDLIKQSEQRSKIYSKLITESEKSFRELNSTNMQGILIQIEDLLDSNDMYAFKNWKDGIIWDGPNVDRYWVSVSIAYPYKKMPDPTAALRLVEMGVRVEFREIVEKISKEIETQEDMDPNTRKPYETDQKLWIIDLMIPRKFIEKSEADSIDPNDKQEESDDNLAAQETETADENTDENPFDDLGDEDEQSSNL